jgi:DNA repair protein RadC
MIPVCQIKVQTVRESDTEYIIRSPLDVQNLWYSEITKSPVFEPEKEMCFVLMVNARNRIVSYNLVSMGSLDASIVEPREVFRPAIASAAHSIILLHNHPSGNMSPSPEDISITKKMIDAGKILGIKVLDHVILSSLPESRNMLSLRESGIVMFG